MANDHDFLKMLQGSQNLCATQKESRTHNKEITAVGYISDTEVIVKPSRSNIQHDGPAALKLSERSPVPPSLSAKNLCGGQSQVVNVRWITRGDRHAVESAEVDAPEIISDTENWLRWNGNLDIPNRSEDKSEADNESDMELDSGLGDWETPDQLNGSAPPNVPRVIPVTWTSTTKSEKVMMMVNTMEMRRNKGNRNK